jgi:TonB family protein
MSASAIAVIACLLITYAAAYCASANSLIKTAPDIRDKWAVVVGINRFQDPAIQLMPVALKNALDISKALKDPQIGRFDPTHVVTICGERGLKATIERVLTATWLVKKALPDDLVVLYFATKVVKSADGQDLYLCAYDTTAADADMTGISLRHLLTEIKYRLQSPYILCVLDTQSAGQMENKGPTVEAIEQETGVSVLAASDNFEESLGTTSNYNTFFTNYLLEGLKDGSGIFPLAKLAGFVQQNVRETAKESLQLEESPTIALASLNKGMPDVEIGLPIKNPNKRSGFTMGYPAASMAMDHPELFVPRTHTVQSPDAAYNLETHAEIDSSEIKFGDIDFAPYMDKIKQDIQKQWHPPKGFESSRVACTFEIMQDGSIANPLVVKTSGIEAVDKSALDALLAASPLDALPQGAPPSVRVSYRFGQGNDSK